ncbi:hypothetical protein B0H13DRAFT_2682742 [Mycena leptocephala]|nr:hypothetical protein B0H13DRAFT_2682742 [Mycena leptocephala]
MRLQPRFLRVSAPSISPSRRRHCVRPLSSASTPIPKRSPPPPTASGLTGQMLKEAPPPPTPQRLDFWQFYSAALERACGTQFELIVRPHLDCASNDICPRRSPTHVTFIRYRTVSVPATPRTILKQDFPSEIRSRLLFPTGTQAF